MMVPTLRGFRLTLAVNVTSAEKRHPDSVSFDATCGRGFRLVQRRLGFNPLAFGASDELPIPEGHSRPGRMIHELDQFWREPRILDGVIFEVNVEGRIGLHAPDHVDHARN